MAISSGSAVGGAGGSTAYDIVEADASAIEFAFDSGAVANVSTNFANPVWTDDITTAGPQTGPFLRLTFAGTTITNDDIMHIRTFFGDGFSMDGVDPVHDMSRAPTGTYEGLIYITTEKGAKISKPFTYDWDQTTLEFSNIVVSAGTPTTYDVSAACVWVQIDEQGNLSDPSDGAAAYTPLGTLAPCAPQLPCAVQPDDDNIKGVQRYYVERHILDSLTAGTATPTISATATTPLVAGTVGNTVTVAPHFRSLLIFFRSDSAEGSYFEMDGIRYNADIGANRADPVLSWSAVDEDSLFVDQPVITAFDGAFVEVQVQRAQ